MITYTRTGLYEYFDQQISKKSIVHDGSEWGISGKYCRITPIDGTKWDLWLRYPAEISKGLGTRRLNRIISVLSEKILSGSPFRVLTGEAYSRAASKELILNNLDLLGIRRKRIVSEKQRQALAGHLAKVRAA